MAQRENDDLADYWAEIQESLTDALVEYKESNPELIKLMETHPYFNTMIRNVFCEWLGAGEYGWRDAQGLSIHSSTDCSSSLSIG